MSGRKYRENDVIIDFSEFPERPSNEWIWEFVRKTLKCTTNNTLCVQIHSTKPLVFIEMQSIELAESLVYQHSKIFATIQGKKYPIPIYFEDGGIDIKVFDLPRLMSDKTITDFFQMYGRVISIKSELHKNNLLEGLPNGVRIVRIKPSGNLELKSFVTIGGEKTQIFYKGMLPKFIHSITDYFTIIFWIIFAVAFLVELSPVLYKEFINWLLHF